MDLRTLRYFVTAAEELNITRAAERLNMSQPPLSNQIKALETELGTPLFIRGKRHLKLTEAGSLLYRRAVQLLELAEQTQQEIRSLDGLSGTIQVSVVDGRAPYLLARWIAGFRAEYPDVRFRLWNGGGDEVFERLDRGLAEIAVVAAPYDRESFEGFPVSREPWVAMIPTHHPLAQVEGECIPLSSLVGEPLIVPSRSSRITAIRTWFEEIGAEPNIVCELSNYLDAVALAEQAVGICIFPQTTYTPNRMLVKKVIVDSARQVEYLLVWARKQRHSELVEEFINFVRDSLEEEKEHRQPYHMPEHEYFPPADTRYLE